MIDSNAFLEKISSFSEPLAHSMGLEILIIEEGMEHHKHILRFFLDKPSQQGGVTIDDCAKFSRALAPILDVEGDLRGRYNLEVSSPGLNRPLVKAEHFQGQVGKIIQVTLHQEIEERRHFKGELVEVLTEKDPAELKMLIDKRFFTIPINKIKKANLDYFATDQNLKSKKKPIRLKDK